MQLVTSFYIVLVLFKVCFFLRRELQHTEFHFLQRDVQVFVLRPRKNASAALNTLCVFLQP